MDRDPARNPKRQLKVLVCGKVQTGRSSLINSLMGASTIEEHLSPDDQPQRCIPYETQVELKDARKSTAVHVVLWDTPGLGGAFSNTEDNLRQVVEKASETDLLIYCISMQTRLERDDVDGIVQLTRALGEDAWRKAVFVLTYANAVQPPPHSVDKVSYFQQLLADWESTIQRVLQNNASVSQEIIGEVAVVPIGYRNQPPPDREDWVTPLWKAVLRTVNDSYILDRIDVSSLTINGPNIIWAQECVHTSNHRVYRLFERHYFRLGSAVVGAIIGASKSRVLIGVIVGACIAFVLGTVVERFVLSWSSNSRH